MLRSSDENASREKPPTTPDPSSRAEISDAERAQIWAVLSGGSSTTAPSSPRQDVHHPHRQDNRDRDSVTVLRRSKMKKFGNVVKRIFMNDQTVQPRKRRDSWDDIYRSKDNAKIRPIHEEYGVL